MDLPHFPSIPLLLTQESKDAINSLEGTIIGVDAVSYDGRNLLVFGYKQAPTFSTFQLLVSGISIPRYEILLDPKTHGHEVVSISPYKMSLLKAVSYILTDGHLPFSAAAYGKRIKDIELHNLKESYSIGKFESVSELLAH